jgi:hypothetical protein
MCRSALAPLTDFFSVILAKQALRGGRGVAVNILDSGTGRSGQHHAPAALIPGERDQAPYVNEIVWVRKF